MTNSLGQLVCDICGEPVESLSVVDLEFSVPTYYGIEGTHTMELCDECLSDLPPAMTLLDPETGDPIGGDA